MNMGGKGEDADTAMARMIAHQLLGEVVVMVVVVVSGGGKIV